MPSPMSAEFDTVAAWTADVALDLGPEYHLPAGCRGSGSAAALLWLVEQLKITPDDRMLDCGAGVGGPGAYAEQETGVRPVLSDPEAGACVAATRLFGFPTVQAASDMPWQDAAFDVVWSLGVVCTVPDQPAFLAELRRVLRPYGRWGLLVFVAAGSQVPNQPHGNNFPTEERLNELLSAADLTVGSSARLSELPAPPQIWQDRAAAVDEELERRHGDDPAWRTAQEQSGKIGSLLSDGTVFGLLLTGVAG